MHYLVVLSGDRVREASNAGVLAARAWCREQGIPLRDPEAVAAATDTTRLRFTEEMKGFVAAGETRHWQGPGSGRGPRRAADGPPHHLARRRPPLHRRPGA